MRKLGSGPSLYTHGTTLPVQVELEVLLARSGSQLSQFRGPWLSGSLGLQHARGLCSSECEPHHCSHHLERTVSVQQHAKP
jgi:hypothetical protein